MTETDALIRSLAADLEAQPRALPLSRLLALAVTVAGAAVLVAVLAGMGVRPDLPAAIAQPAFLAKLGLGAAFALAGIVLAVRLARPDAPDASARWLALAAAPMALGLVWSAQGSEPPVGAPLACVVAIVFLALVPLALALGVLRRGAPARPGAAGAAAGVLAGGLAVLAYALYCPIDSLAYVALWYGIGVLAVAALGAGLGRVTLRW
jgi:hypothetical protein